MFDLNSLSKRELSQHLCKEIMYQMEIDDVAGLEKLCKILVGELPRRYSMRVVSKLYRLRRQNYE